MIGTPATQPLWEEEPSFERNGSATTIHKPHGAFTVFYGHHYSSYDQQKIPQTTTGICIETASSNWVRDPLHTLFMSKVFPQFSGAFEEAEERRIPIYLMDPAIHNALPVAVTEVSLLAAEAIFGMRMGKKALKALQKNGRNLSRRELLSIGARTIGSLWLLLPGLSGVGRLASTLSDTGHGPSAATLQFSNALHPEQLLCTTTLRNVVLAHKQEWLMKNLGGNPHLTTIIGTVHADIETCILSSPEKRLGFLNRVMPALKPFVIPETFFSIAQCVYEKGRWKEGEIFEVRELKEYVTE